MINRSATYVKLAVQTKYPLKMEFGEGANQSNVRTCSTVQDTDINSTCSTVNYTASLVDQPIYYHDQGLVCETTLLHTHANILRY